MRCRYSVLAEKGMSFDNYSPDYGRLPRLAELAAEFPTVTIIVNHLGGNIDPGMSADEVTPAASAETFLSRAIIKWPARSPMPHVQFPKGCTTHL